MDIPKISRRWLPTNKTFLPDPGCVRTSGQAAAAALSWLDGMIFTAGICPLAAMTETTDEIWDRVMSVNLTGCFYAARAVTPFLFEAGGGTIANVASASALLPIGHQLSAYAASQGGLIAFTKAITSELAPSIRCNVVCPGAVDKGRRWSTAAAFLRPALHRPNLTVLSDTLANRVIFRRTKAIGVEVARGRAIKVISANREVILCAGTVATPKLLMLSGIGDAIRLQELGIQVVADRKEVGRNLQDHISFQFRQECTKAITLYKYTRPFGMIAAGFKYALFRRGPAAGVGVDFYGSIVSGPSENRPDIHMAFSNAMLDGMKIIQHGYSLKVWHLRPDSRGWIGLRSADQADEAIIQPIIFHRLKTSLRCVMP